MAQNRLALVTGGSTGIGRQLAQIAAEDGYDVLIAADTPLQDRTALEATGAEVETLIADLGTEAGIEQLFGTLGDRTPHLFFANAGHGLGGPFLDQDAAAIAGVIATNVTWTTLLAHRIASRMVAKGEGAVLFTGSIAGFVPGMYAAVYNASKAYINSFATALGHEIEDSGVSVTCLMPGATETKFFARAGMSDTPAGKADKGDAATVARDGYAAMIAGRDRIVSGLGNKLTVAAAAVAPVGFMTEQHGKAARQPND